MLDINLCLEQLLGKSAWTAQEHSEWSSTDIRGFMHAYRMCIVRVGAIWRMGQKD